MPGVVIRKRSRFFFFLIDLLYPFVQMLPIFHLNGFQNLHRHIRLVQNTSGKRKLPKVTRVTVADWQKDISYVHQPMSVFCVQFSVVSTIEYFLRKTDYLSSFEVVWVKKLADAYSPITLPVRSIFS